MIYYTREPNCGRSWRLVTVSRVAGRRRVLSLLYHLVSLLTNRIQSLPLQEAKEGETEFTCDIRKRIGS